MDESDSMLLTSLQEYIQLPQHLVTLKDIRSEQIFTISLNMLQYMKVDISEISSLSGKSQRFRAMAKLNQALHQHLQAQFQLNQLMNPSVTFLRQFLLAFINKLASLDGNERTTKKTTQAEQQDVKKKQKAIFSKWLKEEWIHPSLQLKQPKYNSHILPITINKNLLKNKFSITKELQNSHLATNVQSILSNTISKHSQKVKQFQANQGLTRKENEEVQLNMQNIVKMNRNDWKINEARMKKIKKRLREKEQPKEVKEEPNASVFQHQVQVVLQQKKQVNEQFQTKKQDQNLTPLADIENPIERMKRQAEQRKKQYENQIRDIINQLKSKKQSIEQWQQQKTKIQQKLINDEQKILQIKQQSQDLRKTLQKRQTILNSIDGDRDVQAQVEKLQSQIQMIQSQASQQILRIQNQIKTIKEESQYKIQTLNDLKIKLNKIENDYTNICQEIVDKEDLKVGVKIMKSGISRLYYSKKISDIEVRWRQTQKQTKKLKVNLVDLRQKTRISSTLNQRVQTEIQNVLNTDKFKGDAQNKNLKQLMKKCQKSFEMTNKILQNINQVKLQTQQFQVKVHTLSGKNYNQNIEKINFAMQDIRKEIKQIQKS